MSDSVKSLTIQLGVLILGIAAASISLNFLFILAVGFSFVFLAVKQGSLLRIRIFSWVNAGLVLAAGVSAFFLLYYLYWCPPSLFWKRLFQFEEFPLPNPYLWVDWDYWCSYLDYLPDRLAWLLLGIDIPLNNTEVIPVQ